MFNYNHIISQNITISMSHVTMTCACATYGRLAIPLSPYNHISYIMTKQYGNMGKKD